MLNMELSPDARAIIDALIDEGYGWLAGELLEQFATGVSPNITAGDAEFDAGAGDYPTSSKEPLGSKPGRVPWHLEVAQDQPAESISPENQAVFAAAYLRVRLVEPFRRLKEAERIAGRLVALQARRSERQTLRPASQRSTRQPTRFALVGGAPVNGDLEGDSTSATEELADALDAVAEAAARMERKS